MKLFTTVYDRAVQPLLRTVWYLIVQSGRSGLAVPPSAASRRIGSL